tara:strand:+ start:621 stop:869 length:249 start_codon:yes stop_codon:yes gene_type:complete
MRAHWRVLQLVRFLLTGVMVVISIGLFIGYLDTSYMAPFDNEYFIAALIFAGLAVASYWAVYATGWAWCWVKEGFSQTKGNS